MSKSLLKATHKSDCHFSRCISLVLGASLKLRAMSSLSMLLQIVPVQSSVLSNETAAQMRGSQPRLDIQGHLARQ